MNNVKEFRLEIDTGPKMMRRINEAVSNWEGDMTERNEMLRAGNDEHDQSASKKMIVPMQRGVGGTENKFESR